MKRRPFRPGSGDPHPEYATTEELDSHVADAVAHGGGSSGLTQAALDAHSADTTTVHGIVDTAAVVLTDDARLTNARTPTAHTHPQSEITNLTTDLTGKASVGHGHVVADTTGLQAALDSKAASAVVTDHVALADPHTQYELSVEKGAVNGYASLDGTGKVPDAQLPGTLARDSEVTSAITSHEAAADPHTIYQRESEKGAANGYASLGADGKVPSSQLPASQGGFSWTATGKQVADLTHASASLVNTDLVFTFEANSVYAIDLYLVCTSVAATTGYRFAVDVSVAVTAVTLTFAHPLANTGTVTAGSSIADATAAGLSSGVPGAGTLTPILGSGLLVTGAGTGTARLVFGPEVAASATFKANSSWRIHKIT